MYLKSASPSPSSTPISTRNPAPIWPLISPSTLTLACSTRWMTARICNSFLFRQISFHSERPWLSTLTT